MYLTGGLVFPALTFNYATWHMDALRPRGVFAYLCLFVREFADVAMMSPSAG